MAKRRHGVQGNATYVDIKTKQLKQAAHAKTMMHKSRKAARADSSYTQAADGSNEHAKVRKMMARSTGLSIHACAAARNAHNEA